MGYWGVRWGSVLVGTTSATPRTHAAGISVFTRSFSILFCSSNSCISETAHVGVAFLCVQTDGFLLMSSVTLLFTAESACVVFLFGCFIWFFALMVRKLLFVCVWWESLLCYHLVPLTPSLFLEC